MKFIKLLGREILYSRDGLPKPKHTRVAVLLLFLAGSVAAQIQPAPLFEDGDRVAFVGDSITHIGKYHVFIADYYHTRFPDRKIGFFNAGIGGDTAAGAIKRIVSDILTFQPNKATVMLGMNDVGHEHFGSPNPSPELANSRKASVERYRRNLTALVEQLQQKNIAVTLITPSPYDHTAQIGADNRIGKNDALAECAVFVRLYAKEHKLPLIEFHAPMVALTKQVQQKEPTRSLVGKDRVHPADEGHLIMAALFLESEQAPSIVADARIHADTGHVDCDNCAIEGLLTNGGGIEFHYAAKALPFPQVNSYDNVDDLLRFTEGSVAKFC